MYKPKKKQQKGKKVLKEPLAAYMPQKLGKVFQTVTVSSYGEMENKRREYSIGLTPAKRMAYLIELNILAFGRLSSKEIKKRFNKTIFIRKPE